MIDLVCDMNFEVSTIWDKECNSGRNSGRKGADDPERAVCRSMVNEAVSVLSTQQRIAPGYVEGGHY